MLEQLPHKSAKRPFKLGDDIRRSDSRREKEKREGKKKEKKKVMGYSL
jgi:hypothetical protein